VHLEHFYKQCNETVSVYEQPKEEEQQVQEEKQNYNIKYQNPFFVVLLNYFFFVNNDFNFYICNSAANNPVDFHNVSTVYTRF